ncbi:MAG: hypothetical protein TECD_00885 [Hyphomicrobiaceae bacterium hypho_1]
MKKRLMNIRDIERQKVCLRKEMATQRKEITKSDQCKKIATFVDQLISITHGSSIFSSYRPFNSELSPLCLEKELKRNGVSIALPKMQHHTRQLSFRLWQEDDMLVLHKTGILEPIDTALLVLPDVVMLPLLAFDKSGRRLGYGGGFYDRSLEKLRSKKSITAVGLAYSEQEVDVVPHYIYDQNLDYILTPNGLQSFHSHRMV